MHIFTWNTYIVHIWEATQTITSIAAIRSMCAQLALVLVNSLDDTLWLLGQSHLRSYFYLISKLCREISLYLSGYCDSGRKCTETTSFLVYVNALATDRNAFSSTLLQISIFNWVAFRMWRNKSPTFVTEPHHL